MAFTLLDGGSGNEVGTGSVHDDEFALHSLDLQRCRKISCGSLVVQCQEHVELGIITAGLCPEDCGAFPLSLCRHKPQNCTLHLLDFRAAEQEVPPALSAHHTACLACLCS